MNSTLNNDNIPWVALVGNPNSGKTAIFNLLTGMNQKVSNYPGITVEKKLGRGNSMMVPFTIYLISQVHIA
ncbi:MAG: hypothetical protein CM1200mP10_24760 [Candidatus Neomarinimicrobiota bacterium]|nr:MAG: hypothetical protein CM1200mP10_24760 [Candidatus Neomarinimicrobiota bacterium]